MRRSKVFAAEFRRRYPTSWLRDWVTMQLSATSIVAAVVAAQLGWMFAAAAWSGGDIEQVRATVVKVEEFVQRRKGCDRAAMLPLESVETETCLDDLYPPATMCAGQHLSTGIIRCPFGFMVVSLDLVEMPTSSTR